MQRYNALENVLSQPNSHAMGVMKLLDQYYPALAKKVFEGNPLMEVMVKANFCSMDILVYPMCGRCESLAAYFKYASTPDGKPLKDKFGKTVGVCKCRKCGAETIAPISFYEWCLMELKKKAPEDIGTELIMAVDIVAERLMTDAKRIYARAYEKEKNYDQSEQS